MDKARVNIDVQEALKSLSQVSDAYKSVGKEASDLDDAARKAMSNTEKGVKGANDELDEQLTLVQRLEKEFGRLDKEINEATDIQQIKKLNKEIEDTDKALKRARKAAKETGKQLKDEANSSGKAFNNLNASIGAAFSAGAAVALILEIKKKADQTKNAEKTVRSFFSATGTLQERLTKQSLFLAQTQEEDIKTVNTAVKNLQNVYKDQGLSAEEAFALVDQSITKGSNVRNELFEILKEYPTQLKKIGLTAKESLAFITQAELSGVFSDKGIDLIKEAGERITRFEKPARDALISLGLPADQLIKDIESGSKSTFDVMQLAAQEIDNLGTKSVKGQKAVEQIFGTAGVDAGEEYIDMLATMDLSLEGLDDKTTELERANREFTKSWIDLTVSGTKSDSIFTKLYAAVLRFSAKAIDFFKELLEKSQPLVDVFVDFKETIFALFESIKGLVKQFISFSKQGSVAKGIMKALAFTTKAALFPISLLSKAWTYLITTITDFIKKSSFLTSVFKKIKTGALAAFDFLINSPAYFAGMLSAGKAALFGLKSLFATTFGNIGKLISAVFSFDKEEIKASFAKLLSETADAASDYGADIKDAFNKGFNDNKIEFKDVKEEVAEEIKEKVEPKVEPIANSFAAKVKKSFELTVPKTIENIDVAPVSLPPLNYVIPKDFQASFSDIWDGLKPNDADIEQIKATASELVSFFDNMAQADLDAANAKVDAKNQEVEELASQLDTELQLNEQGFASDVELKRRELEEAKEQAKAAEAQKAEAQKAQQRIDDAQQISNIITAVSALVKQWASLSPLGYVAGIAQIGIMLAGYATAKSKAKKLRKGATGLKEGLIPGASHEAGGVPFEVEGNEYHSITPVAQAKTYLSLLEAIRLDDKDGMRDNLMRIVGLDDRLNLSVAKDVSFSQSYSQGPNYTRSLDSIHNTLKSSQLNKEYTEGDYRIIKTGNTTRRIKIKK